MKLRMQVTEIEIKAGSSYVSREQVSLAESILDRFWCRLSVNEKAELFVRSLS